MNIVIKNKDICNACKVHNCSFLNMAKSKSDFYNLHSETVVCPTQAITEEGPSDSDIKESRILSSKCVNCGLCVKFCHYHNLDVRDYDDATDLFRNMTEPQVNALTSMYLSTIFKFSANTNRNRSLLFDGYVDDSENEAFVEVDWGDDSLECLRRILGDVLTYSQNHTIKNGIIVLSHLPNEGNRGIFDLITKMKDFPTTNEINIYITSFSLLRKMCLFLKNDIYQMSDLLWDCKKESEIEYTTRIKNILESGSGDSNAIQ